VVKIAKKGAGLYAYAMDKRSLRKLWVRLGLVSYWYFLAAFVVSGIIFILAYRQNNVHMIQLRQDVFTADEQNKDVEKALRELREYVYTHMNTNLASGSNAIKPPIQLKFEYERLVAKEKARVDAANATLRNQAQAICQQQFPVTANATGIQPCIEGYMNEHGVKAQPIPKELYQFDFISPHWSPDLAGWMLVLTIVFGVLFVTRYSLELWLRHQLREHA